MTTTLNRPVDLYPVLSETAELFADDPEFARLIRKAELLCHAKSLARWLKGNPIDIVFVLQAGKDLGLTTYESLCAFYPDDSEEGGLGLHASAQRALLHRAGWGWRIVEATTERCTVALTNPDNPGRGEIHETYTIHDAHVAELLSGPNASYWRRYPRQMLYARVTALAVNAHAAHALWAGPRSLGATLAADPAPVAETRPVPGNTPAPTPLYDPAPEPDLCDEPRMPEPATPTQPGREHPRPEALTAPTPNHGAEPTPNPEPTTADPATSPEPDHVAATEPITGTPDATDASPPPATTHPAPAGPIPDHPHTAPHEPNADERQDAWEPLLRHARTVTEIAVRRILEGDEERTAKEIAAGRITAEDVAAMRAAHKTVGLTPDTVYRTLLRHKAATTAEPDRKSSTALQPAPRPEMPVPDTSTSPAHEEAAAQ
ncbi:hypothetical protein [Kitasatospora aureofaciens]|uniref:hypothetical protein n=1 Tax=Kitasatospora aureofaciens TaxID=1894 RepID=UPI0005258BFB|nr:hypothetical protein [Kitasatospora aureofaciens]